MTQDVSSWCAGCVGACAATRSYCPFTAESRARLAQGYSARGERCPYWRATIPLATRQAA
ncbi:MAG TPA: hypothetical protein VNZ52_11040 [Candidatus Thermoplasmatota archaeon]|nr:hypothetical protein [Candidatus Thermoplasmatota archaeon]